MSSTNDEGWLQAHALRKPLSPIFRTKGKVYVAGGMSEDEDILFIIYYLYQQMHLFFSFLSFLSSGAVGFFSIRRLFWCLSIHILHFWTVV